MVAVLAKTNLPFHGYSVGVPVDAWHSVLRDFCRRRPLAGARDAEESLQSDGLRLGTHADESFAFRLAADSTSPVTSAVICISGDGDVGFFLILGERRSRLSEQWLEATETKRDGVIVVLDLDSIDRL